MVLAGPFLCVRTASLLRLEGVHEGCQVRVGQALGTVTQLHPHRGTFGRWLRRHAPSRFRRGSEVASGPSGRPKTIGGTEGFVAATGSRVNVREPTRRMAKWISPVARPVGPGPFDLGFRFSIGVPERFDGSSGALR